MDYASDDVNPAEPGLYARRGKRVLDVVLALIAAPFVGLTVAVLAVIVRRDGGPAFFGHPRVGKGGRRFTCWKIRTMCVDADAQLERHLSGDPDARAEWNEAQKLRQDPRITAFGAMLRATSLDELPQVWNILRGDMSFVGPRPFTPEQQHLYHGRSYYGLRPGLSGYWQVGDRNDASFAARAVHDARYARDISFATDLRVIFKTVLVVLRGTGR
ncbi:MAG: sugar transferase [Pseudomonadota bacterium]